MSRDVFKFVCVCVCVCVCMCNLVVVVVVGGAVAVCAVVVVCLSQKTKKIKQQFQNHTFCVTSHMPWKPPLEHSGVLRDSTAMLQLGDTQTERARLF